MTKELPFCSRNVAPFFLLMGLFSCAADEQILKLRSDVDQLQKTVANQEQAIGLLRTEERKIWHSLRCADPQVADFVSEAERCQGGQCPQRSMNRVLDFMISQKHVLVRLRADQSPTQMAPLRRAQLMELLGPQQVTQFSRILMLTMQLKLTGDAAVKLPEKLAEDMLLHIRREMNLASQAPRLGMFPVTCDEKSQLLDRYSRMVTQDKPAPGEPKSTEPQVALWIFRVDC